MAAPAYYQQSGDAIARGQRQLKEKETALSTAYQRWEELELARTAGK
jgi:hypothetical protein